jgi:hypothetical protein
VKNRFQNLPFKCNLQRYSLVKEVAFGTTKDRMIVIEVGLCRLNQVDPCPITFNLSNP